MRTKWTKMLLMFTCVVLGTMISRMKVDAGFSENKISCFNAEGKIDSANWNITDDNIKISEDKIVIPAETSSNYTKMIGKTSAKSGDGVKQVVDASVNLCIKKLPANQKLVLAFGLKSIESQLGSEGNVEFVFTNEGGLKLSVVAYTSEGSKVILDKRSCGVSVGTRFGMTMGISDTGLVEVTINGNKICSQQSPVSGEGRFGLLQSGSCGVELYEMYYQTYQYDRPENVNVDVDFEQNEWNTNMVTGQMSLGAERNSGMSIQSLKDGKVLWFKNAKTAWFGTKLQYSNFELSFDIPYFQKTDEVDENGKVLLAKSGAIGIGFGEEDERPTGHGTDTDYLLFDAVSAKSSLKKLWDVDYAEAGLGNLAGSEKENIGYSIKLTVVDQKMTVQVKPLNGTKYTTIAEAECVDFRVGYIKIWVNTLGNFAIDNFKVTNLDENPKLIEVDYRSSVMKVEDYELTDEDTEMKFRPVVEEKGFLQEQISLVIIVASTVLIVALLLVVVILRKRKIKKGGQ